MKTIQLMTDVGTIATGSVTHIPHKTQKFTLWAERRIFLMLQLLAQLSNYWASMHYTVVHINYVDDMGI
jgi:hypothetical protein